MFIGNTDNLFIGFCVDPTYMNEELCDGNEPFSITGERSKTWTKLLSKQETATDDSDTM